MPTGVYKRTPEMNKRMSEATKGKKLSDETKRKISKARIGKRLSVEHRKKLSVSHLGQKHTEDSIVKIKTSLRKYYQNLDARILISQKVKEHYQNHPRSQETCDKISNVNLGEKSHLWKGGVSKPNEIARKRRGIIAWRKKVYERDNYTCRGCLVRGGKLAAHHKVSFSGYPELRTDINNGITLCVKCHELFHKQYGYFNASEDDLNRFLVDQQPKDFKRGDQYVAA